MYAVLLVAVGVVLLGAIALLVVLSFGRRDAGEGPRDLLRVSGDGERDRAEAGDRALGSTAWMRGGGGGC
ncbi:hypothetical protein [Embleya sp. NPDC050493]|uniref:hypothetical protein n=1 Tax=Embleya sp. NPDC050493 TaxID=3363989 RepID=UPI0037A3378F